MKTLKLVLLSLLLVCAMSAQAQEVDEIINNYFENTGGYEKWGEIKSIKTIAKVNQMGMAIPMEMAQLNDGRQYRKITFQGNTVMQGVFDGKTLWGTNFQTMKAEKADAEATEMMKLETNDFPDSFYEYKKKGYTAELVGTETMDGTETFKVKLVKEPITVDGQETENISYYFFDTESFVILAMETEAKSGPAKGQTTTIKMSNYEEVDGLYFPFSIEQNFGNFSMSIEVESIELNPSIDESLFAFPEGE